MLKLLFILELKHSLESFYFNLKGLLKCMLPTRYQNLFSIKLETELSVEEESCF